MEGHMPGPREVRQAQAFYDKLLGENARKACESREAWKERAKELAPSEGKKLRRKLEAEGWPRKEIDARVHEFVERLSTREGEIEWLARQVLEMHRKREEELRRS